MSCQKGNSNRSRSQKHQNAHSYKNNLHDTSHRTKAINNIQVANVCERCKKIIEWKIKYKKYKPLKAPSKCTKCMAKCVKHAYHTMCEPCASKFQVCPKCGENGKIIKLDNKEDPVKLDRELRLLLKKLPERKRRTFLRYMNGGGKKNKEEMEASIDEDGKKSHENKVEVDLNPDKEDEIAHEKPSLTREDLLAKLQSLLISSRRKNIDNDDDDLNDFSSNLDEDISYDSSDNATDNDENDTNDSDSTDTSNKSKE